MTIQDFINKAIEGGWKYQGETPMTSEYMEAPAVASFAVDGIDFKITKEQALLDSKAWKAVGKVEMWGVYKEEGKRDRPIWQHKMHAMIDALIEGKSLEEYINTL